MATGLRRYLLAGLALNTAVAIAVAAPPTDPGTGPAVTLTSGESLLNVGLNLLQDIVNIPYNEVQALTTTAQSLLFTGPWFVGSPTNVWGEDPGDPGHFEAVIQLFVPFPELSGLGHEGDYSYPGLGQQLAMLAAVEIPAHPSCQSLDCLPMVPTSPITGFTWIDQAVWTLLIATFVQKIPVFENWFQVPLAELTTGDGYYFDPAAPGSFNSGPAYEYPGFPWPGTQQVTAADGTEHYLMPWAGTNFVWDPAAPFENYFNSLLQPFDPGEFQLPDLVEFARAVQAVAAGVFLDFNPFVTGSPLCPGPCTLPGDEQTYHAVIAAIDALWPGNKLLETWLSVYEAGTANVSTPEIVDYLTWAWRNQTVVFDFDNELAAQFDNGVKTGLVLDTSAALPTLAQVNDWIDTNLGEPWRVFFNNIGLLGPFDFENLTDLFFPAAA